MSSTVIQKEVFNYLRDLKGHNNRDWFNTNKPHYQKVYENFKNFAKSLEDEMSLHDEIERMRIHRIYRDVRFSKDKTPYKNHFSGGFIRATKWKRGGYYFHIEPGQSFLGGGFWGPESSDLKRIRQDIAADASPLRKLITTPAFIENFELLEGAQLKTAPKGFPKDHPNIDLLRYKQFVVRRQFTDKEVCLPDFAKKASMVFQQMRPFFNYMSDVLTTDENGVPIE